MTRTSRLSEARALLKEARRDLDRMPRAQTPEQHSEAAWARMHLAALYAQVAAIEAGLAPAPLPRTPQGGISHREVA
jgi:hypothetical protein